MSHEVPIFLSGSGGLLEGHLILLKNIVSLWLAMCLTLFTDHSLTSSVLNFVLTEEHTVGLYLGIC